jgi:4-hydroxy-tetrahydrodipicolinate synthase
MKQLGRLLTAMVTPFDNSGKVDYQQARNLAQALLDSGSDGLIISGTTGESPNLTLEEKLQLFTEVKSAIGNRGALVAGTGSYNTSESQELTREAEKIGVDACLLVVPYYNRPTQQGLFEHFKAIAQSTSLPCIPYNVPSRTALNLTAETMIKLSQIDNIVAVKEASANLRQVAEIIEGTPEDFMVYSGNDSDTLPFLALGGYGVISVASHLIGLQIKSMIGKFLKGETQIAAEIHRRVLPVMNSLFIITNPMPVKYALNYVGFPVGKPRLPLLEADSKTAEVIRTTLDSYKIDLPGLHRKS